MTVSTIFLGVDHGFGVGPPLLWETLVHDSNSADRIIARYTSYEDACAGHASTLALVKRLQSVRSGQRYRHRKGNFYEVTAVVRHAKSLMRHVVYRNIEDGQTWVRELAAFVEVLPEGPRFAEVLDGG
jgi:hypothetical protein